MNASNHTFHSSYREMVLEHLFIGEILKHCWQKQRPRVEILKSQVDDSGYDIVLVADTFIRYVQLKSSFVGAATPRVTINIGLAEKPSGCVIWMQFDPKSLMFDSFLWFGGDKDQPLPSLERFEVATHTKRNSLGVKTLRKNMRYVKKSAFTKLDTIADVVDVLFGSVAPDSSENDPTEYDPDTTSWPGKTPVRSEVRT
ncbi:MAG: hypothetical protein WKF81_07525 [Thermomicrobiales bacterium]